MTFAWERRKRKGVKESDGGGVGGENKRVSERASERANGRKGERETERKNE